MKNPTENYSPNPDLSAVRDRLEEVYRMILETQAENSPNQVRCHG